jgi:6-phospho-beta-glucosidase
MAMPDSLKIAYIGGGSRFVVVLLHGLAGEAAQLRALGHPIELSLMDINPERAKPMARYAEITASEKGLNLKTSITDDRDEALDGADWILFSVGAWREIREIRERLRKPLGNPHGESTPIAAIEAASLWPYMRQLAEDIHRLASLEAVFSTLVNPTDVLSGAFEKAFDIKSIGTCVEVPQLKTWLCHNLKTEYDDIRLEHIGANHVGWVSRWTVAGQDGPSLFSEKLPEISGLRRYSRQLATYAAVPTITGRFWRTGTVTGSREENSTKRPFSLKERSSEKES